MRNPYAQFHDRSDAGRQLARRLKAYADQPDVLVLALPRGGLPVAYEIARALHAPLDVCLVRKLGVPGHGELAMGAIASGGVRVLNADIIASLGISETAIEDVAAQEGKELQRRDRAYRGDRPPLSIQDRTVILVDDGIATGSTMRAAIQVLQSQAPGRLIVAVPVAPPVIIQELSADVDEIVWLIAPEHLYAISIWYETFAQTTDVEVHQLLAAPLSVDCSPVVRE